MNEDILNQLGQPSEVPEEDTEIKVDDKKKSSGKALDDEVIASMMANGDNTKGMFEPKESEVKDKDEKLHEDQDDKVKLKTKGNAKPSDKYVTEFQKDMQKNPEDYFINTPKGKMSIKEAKEQGYDPRTHRFRKKGPDKKREEELLSQVNDKDREAIERMMDPSQVGLAPADAQSLGLKPDSKMIRQGNPAEQQPSAQVPTQMSSPMSQGNPAMTKGQPDINALLGGNV